MLYQPKVLVPTMNNNERLIQIIQTNICTCLKYASITTKTFQVLHFRFLTFGFNTKH